MLTIWILTSFDDLNIARFLFLYFLVAGHVRFGNSEHFALAQQVLTQELADAKKREQLAMAYEDLKAGGWWLVVGSFSGHYV